MHWFRFDLLADVPSAALQDVPSAYGKLNCFLVMSEVRFVQKLPLQARDLQAISKLQIVRLYGTDRLELQQQMI